jgi:tRNA pseudouridine55 synthase
VLVDEPAVKSLAMPSNSKTFDFAAGELLLIDKPYDMTSFGVIGAVRRITKVKKVGHAGTLDPLATGLMLVATGKKTKQLTDLTGQDKRYLATLKLGATTVCYDAEAPEENHQPTTHITQEAIEAALPAFRGEIMQRPPIFSAIKVGGRRAYKSARSGQEVEIPEREVTIHSLALVDFHEAQFATLNVHCSKGTYIRSLAHDIGQALGVGAYLYDLRRTAIGAFSIDDALSLEQLDALVNPT